MSKVVNLVVVEAGQNFRLNPDKVLEGAKGLAFKKMVILGEMEDGSLYTAGNANSGETLILMKWAEHMIVFGKDARE